MSEMGVPSERKLTVYIDEDVLAGLKEQLKSKIRLFNG
jgi:hypothetical protein